MPKGVGYPNKSSVPMVKARKKKKSGDLLSLRVLQPPKKGEPVKMGSKKKSDAHKTSASEELKTGIAKGLATASAGISGRGSAGRILKAGLAGASGGAEIDASYQRFKDKAAKKRGKKAKTTVSQSAMKQKAQFHKKEHSKTEKV